ncbi:hypothetical protein BDP27DRAFT_1212795 [Rhodocollybia butyracea]|uniref:JmjC domain-containing protein n=1 Tax=Rhodocollybia butyracea TaxID=206335 RepID=A0A9P5PYY6_9AGAR|nr:hypothetical protein BDP27DRAFT_1212795 [Rhodocollybia butyracea]
MNRRVEKSKAPNPILTSKGWTLEVLLGRGKRFLPAPRISVLQDDLNDCISFYENSGIPFVVENLHHLPGWANDFVNIDWLENSSEITNIPARNIRTACDVLLSLSEFIEKSRNSSVYYQEGETERLYGKDLYLPEEWTNWLKTANVVPEQFLPDSDNLLTHLPESAKVETLMCYIGTGDTFTPSHKDLCSSHGHNLMCFTENGGSSFWFMTKRADARTVADYFHTKFGHEIDHESHITTVDDFADAPFDVYIVEQKLGDLVLVPRMSCHQVVNSGGLTVKLSWSRMTMKSIEQAIYYELPLYHRVCRPEIYRVRLTLYHTIKMYHAQFEDFTYTGDKKLEASRRLGVLLRTFDHVLKNECTKDYTSLPCLAPSGQETDALSCDFCGCDIFQSYFECISCTSSVEGDFCTICPDCYAEGRSCHCRLMQPKQVQPLDDVLQERAGTIEVLQSYWKSINEKGVSFASRK